MAAVVLFFSLRAPVPGRRDPTPSTKGRPMTPSLPRRAALAALVPLLALPLAACGTEDTGNASSPDASATAGQPKREFTALERKFDAKLGVYALDTGSGKEIAHRPDTRFAHASTFKALLAGVILKQTSAADLDERVEYTEQDLPEYSPITERHASDGMTLRELCDAAVRHSDNGAANLLIRHLGGPAELQKALRTGGDRVTHTDRYETEMSAAEPGDVRDTSTPRALAGSLRTYALQDALPARKRTMLTDWLKRNTTGDDLIRAGAPKGWKVGDKTGNGGYGTRNDIAVVWPPKSDPIVLAVLSKRDTKNAEHDDALVADAAEVALEALA